MGEGGSGTDVAVVGARGWWAERPRGRLGTVGESPPPRAQFEGGRAGRGLAPGCALKPFSTRAARRGDRLSDRERSGKKKTKRPFRPKPAPVPGGAGGRWENTSLSPPAPACLRLR